MNFRMLMMYSKFRNNNYFVNLEEYLKERIDDGKLSYENLKYLYKELYRGHSLYVKQNIFQVGEFLSKGFSTEEAERIANILPDAKKYTVFCYDEKEVGYKYNKLFKDLEFAYSKYEKFCNRYDSKDKAFERLENTIKNTTVAEREDYTEKDKSKDIEHEELEIN